MSNYKRPYAYKWPLDAVVRRRLRPPPMKTTIARSDDWQTHRAAQKSTKKATEFQFGRWYAHFALYWFPLILLLIAMPALQKQLFQAAHTYSNWMSSGIRKVNVPSICHCSASANSGPTKLSHVYTTVWQLTTSAATLPSCYHTECLQ